MEIKNCKLIQGDCLEVLPQIPDNSVDLILCDLPYGTTKCFWDTLIPFDDYIEVALPKQNSKLLKVTQQDLLQGRLPKGINNAAVQELFIKNKKPGLWTQYKRVLKDRGVVLLFGQEPFSSVIRMSNLEDYRYDIYWEKERLTNINQVKKRVGKTIETISVFYEKQGTYNPQMLKYEGKPRSNKVKNGTLGKLTDDQVKKVTEYIDTGWRYPTQVWRYQRDCLKSNLHPTQKPVALLENLIKTFSNEGDTVLDNCMGSGSTGVACINTNRKFIGIELNSYFDIAQNRLEQIK